MNKIYLFSVFITFILFSSCQNSKQEEKPKSSILAGSIKVLVDESLEPIVKEQLAVFESSYSDAKIELVFKPENQVMNMMRQDSAEVAVATRNFNEDELSYYTKRGIKPRVFQFAVDAVTLIVNKKDSDSIITVDQVSSLIKGEGTKQLVFDNANSGTVRFLKELAGVEELPSTGVYAVKSNPEVIHYVFNNPGSIGVVGLNWIVRPDSLSNKFLSQIRVLKVGTSSASDDNSSTEIEYFEPTQSNLALHKYPLARPVYIINAEPRYGLGMGFSAFLTSDRGQRIVLKSGLLPDSLPPREIFIRNK